MSIVLLLSRNIHNNTKLKIVFPTILIIFFSPIMLSQRSPFGMIGRALVFSAFPSACPQHVSTGDGAYVCYRYQRLGNDMVGDYSIDDNWIIVDKTGEIQTPSDTWPEYLKNFFTEVPHARGFSHGAVRPEFTPRARDEMLKKLKLKVTYVTSHTYWVHRYCDNMLKE
jgi:hypothetical protein